MSIYLRALSKDDLDRLHEWHNDRALYSTLVNGFRFVSKDAEAEWLNGKLAYSVSEVALAICLSGDDTHIGNIYLTDINWIARRCSLGIFIASPEHRGKGCGSAALRLIVEHAFRDLGLRRICFEVLSDNHAAIAAYEKFGFRTEGILRKHVFKDGAYKDVIVMGLCAEDLPSMERPGNEIS